MPLKIPLIIAIIPKIITSTTTLFVLANLNNALMKKILTNVATTIEINKPDRLTE